MGVYAQNPEISVGKHPQLGSGFYAYPSWFSVHALPGWGSDHQAVKNAIWL